MSSEGLKMAYGRCLIGRRSKKKLCDPRRKRRMTYPEAARELRVSENWLRAHIMELPHGKIGKFVYFTENDLECIDEMFHREPIVQSARPVTRHPLAELKPSSRSRPGASPSS
ncbi:helix-turn-helix domain-containing protein [Streptomyces sp. NPDC005863]|uniref:Helix-turn-helix domain-containing protein n=1 Tax=Streptomyces doudnae TaxID=3075536 RepID=A0ABD5EYK1_9ACTN|nr:MULTISPECIES: helix-turn-helix domain-containing protein [unclassified Streptomyces]MDT0439735.1 helix-turn-helix domain-containing protein [Streptomyces sp. DSM 41981]MYQ69328.1 hypothetical protein [Streptomyces sp. SID4950]